MLPHAIANGRNQNGTMAGKLKGAIAAQTPTGWRNVSQSTAVATFSSTRPCIVWGIGRRRLDHLDRAADLGPRVGEGLAHLAGDRSRDLVLVRLQHLPEPEQPAGALDRRAAAPGREGGAGGGDGGVDVRGARQRHPREHLAGGRVGHIEVLGGGGRHASGPRCSCPAGGSRSRPGTSAIHFRGSVAESPCVAARPARAPPYTLSRMTDISGQSVLTVSDLLALERAAQRAGQRGGRRPPAGKSGGVGARVRDAGRDRDAARRRVPAHHRHRAGGDDDRPRWMRWSPRWPGPARPESGSSPVHAPAEPLTAACRDARAAAAGVRPAGAVRRHHPRRARAPGSRRAGHAAAGGVAAGAAAGGGPRGAGTGRPGGGAGRGAGGAGAARARATARRSRAPPRPGSTSPSWRRSTAIASGCRRPCTRGRCSRARGCTCCPAAVTSSTCWPWTRRRSCWRWRWPRSRRPRRCRRRSGRGCCRRLAEGRAGSGQEIMRRRAVGRRRPVARQAVGDSRPRVAGAARAAGLGRAGRRPARDWSRSRRRRRPTRRSPAT